jgi:hypothetical protein
MTITSEDIDLAKELLVIWKQSSSADEFHQKVEVLEATEKAIAEIEHQQLESEQFEKSYQKLLFSAGGHADVLARELYRYALELLPSDKNPLAVPATSSGRPPDRWGREGAGRVMLYFIVEDILNEMRKQGIQRPKIQDAIAQYLGIRPECRTRNAYRLRIHDYAARYSEAKKILKPVKK